LSSRQLRYCSNACKQADYRDRIPYNRLADLALTVLRPPADSLVAGGDMSPGFDWRDRVAFIRTYYLEVWSMFGEDVLAASARPMPLATCRWCWAFATARVGNRKATLTRAVVSTAAQRLLGEPCARCRTRAFATVKRHVDAGRPKAPAASFGDGVRVPDRSAHHVARAASPDPPTRLHDPFGTCTTCKEYRDTHPVAALTASGIPAGCAPHPWNEKPGQHWSW
jgi:hypothetical protein